MEPRRSTRGYVPGTVQEIAVRQVPTIARPRALAEMPWRTANCYAKAAGTFALAVLCLFVSWGRFSGE